MNFQVINKEQGYVVYLQNGRPQLIGAGANGKVLMGAINYGMPNEMSSAVKQIPRPPYEYWQKKLKDESMIHANIEHPNIVKYYGFHEDRNFYYLFLELCNGHPLSSIIAIPQSSYSSRTKKLSEALANRYIIPMIDALYYLSNVMIQPAKNEKQGLDEAWQGVSHRDIKPENIMIVNEEPKLIDFGLVKQQNPDVDPTLHRGTPFYMSPQNLNNQTYDPQKNDVWSMGVMWYQLLHGYFPWKMEVKTEMELIFQHKQMTITFDQNISKDVQHVIRAMLSYAEEDRPAWSDVIKFQALQKIFAEKEKKKKILEQSAELFPQFKQVLESCNLSKTLKENILQAVLHIQTNLFVKFKECIMKNTKFEKIKSEVLEQQMFLMDFGVDVTWNFVFELKQAILALIRMELVNQTSQLLQLLQIVSFWVCLEDNTNLSILEIKEKIEKL